MTKLDTMTFEELEQAVKDLYGEDLGMTEWFVRNHDPGATANRANGCGKYEIWVRKIDPRHPGNKDRYISYGRWGGGPTREAALEKAVESLAYYQESEKRRR